MSKPTTRCGSITVFYLGTTARWFLINFDRPLSLELGPRRTSIDVVETAEDFDKRRLEVAAEIAKARR